MSKIMQQFGNVRESSNETTEYIDLFRVLSAFKHIIFFENKIYSMPCMTYCARLLAFYLESV